MSDGELNLTASRTWSRAGLPASILVALSIALLAGCAKRDSVVVGSIPDDYRTNHPIVIAEKDEVLDLPVAASDRGITKSQKIAINGFMAGYDRSASPVVTVMTPVGSANEVAATHLARDISKQLRSNAVSQGRIIFSSYGAGNPDASAPVRISFTAMRAQTGKCGRWTDDLANTAENKHYTDFGCSYQNNLAAQIADPADLLGPRKPGPIDAENRGAAIDRYKSGVVADEFESNSEVDTNF